MLSSRMHTACPSLLRWRRSRLEVEPLRIRRKLNAPGEVPFRAASSSVVVKFAITGVVALRSMTPSLVACGEGEVVSPRSRRYCRPVRSHS